MRGVISRYRGFVSDTVLRMAFPPWVLVDPGQRLYTFLGTSLSLAETYSRYARYLRRNDPLKASLHDQVDLFYRPVAERPGSCTVRINNEHITLPVTDDYIEFLGADVSYLILDGVLRIPSGVNDFIIYRENSDLVLSLVTSSRYYRAVYPFESFTDDSSIIGKQIVRRRLISIPNFVTYVPLASFSPIQSQPYFTTSKRVKIIDPFHKKEGISFSWIINDGEIVHQSLVDPTTYVSEPLAISDRSFPYSDTPTDYEFTIEFTSGVIKLINPVSPFYLLYEYDTVSPYLSFSDSYDYIQSGLNIDYPDEVVAEGTTGVMYVDANHMVVDVALNNLISNSELLIARLISHAYMGTDGGVTTNKSDGDIHYYEFTKVPIPSTPYDFGYWEREDGLLYQVILQRAEVINDLHDPDMSDVILFPSGSDLKPYFDVSYEGNFVRFVPKEQLRNTAEYGTDDFKFMFIFKYVLIYTVEGDIPIIGGIRYVDEVLNWETPYAWVLGPLTAYFASTSDGYGERYIFTGNLNDYRVILQDDIHRYDPEHPDVPGPILYAGGDDITDLVSIDVREDYIRIVPSIDLSFNGYEFRNPSATVPSIRVSGTLQVDTIGYYRLEALPENATRMYLSLFPFVHRTKDTVISRYNQFEANVHITDVTVYSFMCYIDSVVIEDAITVGELQPVRAYVLEAYPSRLFLYYMGTGDTEYIDFDASIYSIAHYDGYIILAMGNGIYFYDLYKDETRRLLEGTFDRIRIGPDNRLYAKKGNRIFIYKLVRDRVFYNGEELVSYYPIE